MATAEVVTQLLNGLWTTYSRYPPADMREAAYASWFATLRNVADNDLKAAVLRWVENEPNLPVPASLLAMSDTERHRRLAPKPRDDGGMLPVPEYPIPPGEAFGVLKEVRKAASEGKGADEIWDTVVDHYRDDWGPGDDAKTYGCLRCRDNRFVVVPKTNNTVRPCQDCNGRAYERWAKGHFLPNHHCAECEDIHRGRRGRRGDDE